MKIYDITPIGKPRMTRADKWKQRPEVIRYRAFCDEARLRKIHLPDSGAHVTFVMPMPQSWSQKKRAQYAGRPHQSKPDCDNMLKALMDALYEDIHTSGIAASPKYGARKGRSSLGNLYDPRSLHAVPNRER